jgi:hypothetical protein
MPQIAYYLGRPASFWIAVMSRHARATAANAPAATSPASQRPVVPTAPEAKVTATTVKQKHPSRSGLQPRSVPPDRRSTRDGGNRGRPAPGIGVTGSSGMTRPSVPDAGP